MKLTLLLSVGSTLSALVLSGCTTAEQQAQWAELERKAADVRMLSPSDTEDCKLLRQASITEPQHLLGQAHTENEAIQKLRMRTADWGGNAMRITDRQLDKGRGGYDRTKVTVYADLYLCGEETS